MTDPVVSQDEVRDAVVNFWESRAADDEDEEAAPAQEGHRDEVISDSHMAEFGAILYEKLRETGLPETAIGTDGDLTDQTTDLPGYFRPAKDWDLVVVQDGHLIAAVEFKSQASSYGNNWNNRVEEAIGNAWDLRTAIDEGVIESPVRPWLGYFYLMGEQGTTEGKNTSLPAMRRKNMFSNLSYADRCEKLCLRLVEQDLYDEAAFILAEDEDREGAFRAPTEQLTFERFAASLVAHVEDFLDTHGKRQQRLETYE